MNIDFPPLKVETDSDGALVLIDPTDDGDGNLWRVRVHPMQLRFIAEQAGVIGLAPVVDATGELLRLVPWLEMIETRASQLHDNIMGLSQRGHEDMGIEVAQSSALADVAEQVLDDVKALVSRAVTPSHATASHVTPCHATERQRAPGNADSVTHALPERDLGVTVPPGKSPEKHAMDAFTAFVQQNRELLRLVAPWGDGECGALANVLKRELLGHKPKDTPAAPQAGQGSLI